MPQTEKKSEQFVVAGKMYYGHLHPEYPDTVYTPRWGMALSVDSDMQNVATSNGMVLKDATSIMENPYVNLHKNVKKANGEDNSAPVVLDSKKNLIPSDVLSRLGWGSDVKVLVSKFWMSKWKKWGYVIDKVQVINLVEYTNDDGLNEEDGFDSAPTDTSPSNTNLDDDLPF